MVSLAHSAGLHTVMVAISLVPAGFDLLLVHLPQTDQTGHASGWMSAEYLAQVQQTDAAVGRLVSV